jgi:CDP-diacylglycerol--glycerol-3-phosphate 3-phosphatidyltransferase
VTRALLRLSSSAEPAAGAARIDISSGYLNLHEGYSQILVHGETPVRILTASPKANGFYGARGIAGALPLAYSLIEHQFVATCQAVSRYGGAAGVRLFEYTRPHWTFHCKGVWLTPWRAPGRAGGTAGGGEELPFCTVIGSPNLGRRSVDRDFESALVVLTTHEPLQRQLAEERRRLFDAHTEGEFFYVPLHITRIVLTI